MSDISWLNELSKEDASSFGEKAAYLGELISSGLPVPPGFAISTDAYKECYAQIKQEVEQTLASTDPNSLDSLNRSANKIRELFMSIDLPTDLELEISAAYKKMSAMPEEYKGVNKIALDFIKAGRDRPFLILRPSPKDHGPPSQQVNFFDITGVDELFQKMKLSWASLFTPRAIHYRKRRNLPNPEMAVIIQERPNLLKSGNVFTVNPLNNNKNQLLIQARWGFSKKNSGEADIFFYDKTAKQLAEKHISDQKDFYVFDPQIMKVARRDLPLELKDVDLLNANELNMIENVSNKINSVFKFPQDIEWGIAKGKFYVLQSRPITSVFKKPIISNSNSNHEPYLTGLPSSPGRIKGKVSGRPERGGVLFAKELRSNVFNSIFGASALITETGDLKSLHSIIARELEIPCIIRVNSASQKLREGQEISVDAFSGKIYTDQVVNAPESQELTAPQATQYPDSEGMDSDGIVEHSHDEPVNVVLSKLSDLEATLTELVLAEAQKRQEDPHSSDNGKAKMISDLEWEVRSLREKVEKIIDPSQNQP